MHRALPALVLVIAAAGVLSACGDDEYGDPPGPGETRSANPGKAQVVARDFAFDPTALTTAMSAYLEVTLTNEGAAPHTFTVDELFVDQTVQPGKKVSFRITPSEPGEFTFYCRFHAANGMLGSLVVSATGQTAAPQASPAPSGSPGDTNY